MWIACTDTLPSGIHSYEVRGVIAMTLASLGSVYSANKVKAIDAPDADKWKPFCPEEFIRQQDSDSA